MFYMGEEVGMDNAIPDHPEPNKIDWDRADEGTRTYYKNMIRLRLTHPTLAGSGIEFFCPNWSQGQGPCQQEKVICYWRFPGSQPTEADIVVASNFDHADHEFQIPFPSSGTWYRYDPETGAVPVEVEDSQLSMILSASTAHLFLKEPPPAY
jgi:hypothetical protein